jgi:pimeloyl-ACP methyl ester carboxylesterase
MPAGYSRGIGQTVDNGAVTTMAAETPTIVFVHGAWADASGFGGVIRVLGDRGFTAIGMANPLRHLTGDAAYLAALLGTISGPIVLVGHSYGGAVMSNAAIGNEQLQALVFCNGWMPDEGESIQQLFEESEVFAGSLVPAAIRPVPFTNPDGSEGVDLYLDRELFPEAFAADVDPETAKVMAATQRPWSGAGTPGPRARRGGGPSRRGTWWAPRTEPSRRRGSASWPSVRTRRSSRWRRRSRPWCRSRRP